MNIEAWMNTESNYALLSITTSYWALLEYTSRLHLD